MSNRTEWGHIAPALYTLHPRDRVADELRPDDPDAITASFVVGIWTENGDGIALEGDRRELLAFATALTAFLERETTPIPALSHALADLHTLRQRRGAALDCNDQSEVSRLDELEVDLLGAVADAADVVHDQM